MPAFSLGVIEDNYDVALCVSQRRPNSSSTVNWAAPSPSSFEGSPIEVSCRGSNAHGEAGPYDSAVVQSAWHHVLTLAAGVEVAELRGGTGFFVALLSNNTVIAWGSGWRSSVHSLALSSVTSWSSAVPLHNLRAGWGYFCVVEASGDTRVLCAGRIPRFLQSPLHVSRKPAPQLQSDALSTELHTELMALPGLRNVTSVSLSKFSFAALQSTGRMVFAGWDAGNTAWTSDWYPDKQKPVVRQMDLSAMRVALDKQTSQHASSNSTALMSRVPAHTSSDHVPLSIAAAGPLTCTLGQRAIAMELQEQAQAVRLLQVACTWQGTARFSAELVATSVGMQQLNSSGLPSEQAILALAMLELQASEVELAWNTVPHLQVHRHQVCVLLSHGKSSQPVDSWCVVSLELELKPVPVFTYVDVSTAPRGSPIVVPPLRESGLNLSRIITMSSMSVLSSGYACSPSRPPAFASRTGWVVAERGGQLYVQWHELCVVVSAWYTTDALTHTTTNTSSTYTTYLPLLPVSMVDRVETHEAWVCASGVSSWGLEHSAHRLRRNVSIYCGMVHGEEVLVANLSDAWSAPDLDLPARVQASEALSWALHVSGSISLWQLQNSVLCVVHAQPNVQLRCWQLWQNGSYVAMPVPELPSLPAQVSIGVHALCIQWSNLSVSCVQDWRSGGSVFTSLDRRAAPVPLSSLDHEVAVDANCTGIQLSHGSAQVHGCAGDQLTMLTSTSVGVCADDPGMSVMQLLESGTAQADHSDNSDGGGGNANNDATFDVASSWCNAHVALDLAQPATGPSMPVHDTVQAVAVRIPTEEAIADVAVGLVPALQSSTPGSRGVSLNPSLRRVKVRGHDMYCQVSMTGTGMNCSTGTQQQQQLALYGVQLALYMPLSPSMASQATMLQTQGAVLSRYANSTLVQQASTLVQSGSASVISMTGQLPGPWHLQRKSPSSTIAWSVKSAEVMEVHGCGASAHSCPSVSIVNITLVIPEVSMAAVSRMSQVQIRATGPVAVMDCPIMSITAVNGSGVAVVCTLSPWVGMATVHVLDAAGVPVVYSAASVAWMLRVQSVSVAGGAMITDAVLQGSMDHAIVLELHGDFGPAGVASLGLPIRVTLENGLGVSSPGLSAALPSVGLIKLTIPPAYGTGWQLTGLEVQGSSVDISMVQFRVDYPSPVVHTVNSTLQVGADGTSVVNEVHLFGSRFGGHASGANFTVIQLQNVACGDVQWHSPSHLQCTYLSNLNGVVSVSLAVAGLVAPTLVEPLAVLALCGSGVLCGVGLPPASNISVAAWLSGSQLGMAPQSTAGSIIAAPGMPWDAAVSFAVASGTAGQSVLSGKALLGLPLRPAVQLRVVRVAGTSVQTVDPNSAEGIQILNVQPECAIGWHSTDAGYSDSLAAAFTLHGTSMKLADGYGTFSDFHVRTSDIAAWLVGTSYATLPLLITCTRESAVVQQPFQLYVARPEPVLRITGGPGVPVNASQHATTRCAYVGMSEHVVLYTEPNVQLPYDIQLGFVEHALVQTLDTTQCHAMQPAPAAANMECEMLLQQVMSTRAAEREAVLQSTPVLGMGTDGWVRMTGIRADVVSGSQVMLQANCTVQGSSTPAVEVELVAPGCARGAVVDPLSMRCVPCSTGTWTPWDAPNELHQCLSCPAGAACPGGASLPRSVPGYWQPSPYSTQLYRCPVPSACKSLLQDPDLVSSDVRLAAGNFSIRYMGRAGSGFDDPAAGLPVLSVTGSQPAWESSCVDAHRGRLCSTCEAGQGRIAGLCAVCPPLGGMIAWLLLGATIVMLVVCVLVVSNRGARRGWQPTDADESASARVSAMQKIALGHIQLLSFSLALEVEYPRPQVSFVGMLATVGNPVTSDSVMPIDCMLRSISDSVFVAKQIIVLCAPLMFILVPACVWLCIELVHLRKRAHAQFGGQPGLTKLIAYELVLRTCGRRCASCLRSSLSLHDSATQSRSTIWRRIAVSCVLCTHIMLPTLTQRAAVMWSSIGHSDVKYIPEPENTGVPAWTNITAQVYRSGGAWVVKEHQRWLVGDMNLASGDLGVALGLGSLYMVYMLGMPLVVGYVLRTARPTRSGATTVAKLATQQQQQQQSATPVTRAAMLAATNYLSKCYHPDVYWWDVVVLIRRMVAMLTTLLLIPFGLQVQLMSVLIILIAMTLTHVHYRPQREPDMQHTETVSLVTLMFTYATAQYFFAGTSPGAEMFLVVVLLVSNAGVIAWLLVRYVYMLKDHGAVRAGRKAFLVAQARIAQMRNSPSPSLSQKQATSSGRTNSSAAGDSEWQSNPLQAMPHPVARRFSMNPDLVAQRKRRLSMR